MIIASIFLVGLIIAIAGVIYPFSPFKKRWRALLTVIVCFVAVGILSWPPTSETTSEDPEKIASLPEISDKFWVTAERLNRRTCPSTECGIVGRLFFREAALIFERRDGWARITEPYNASCVGGRSEYVDTGNAACDSSNGITDGRFAEWVSARFLSQDRPPDPAADASGAEELVAQSDDFARYRTAFAAAAQSLIEQRRCTEGDFRDIGGWLRTSDNRQPIYFTYCGGGSTPTRFYLNAETGKIFQ